MTDIIDVFASTITINVPIILNDGKEEQLAFEFEQPTDDMVFSIISIIEKIDSVVELQKKTAEYQKTGDISKIKNDVDADLMILLRSKTVDLMSDTILNGYSFDPSRMDGKTYINKLDFGLRNHLSTEFLTMVTDALDGKSKKFQVRKSLAGGTPPS